MHFGSLLKKNQRLKALKEDEAEYRRGKLGFPLRRNAYSHFGLCPVKKLFEEGWLHPNKPLPIIRSIFKLLKTGDEMGDYHMYK